LVKSIEFMTPISIRKKAVGAWQQAESKEGRRRTACRSPTGVSRCHEGKGKPTLFPNGGPGNYTVSGKVLVVRKTGCDSISNLRSL
jgi:hypothetical protein